MEGMLFQKCLLLDPNNKVCRYMQGLAFSSLGQFYEGIKTQTKVFTLQLLSMEYVCLINWVILVTARLVTISSVYY